MTALLGSAPTALALPNGYNRLRTGAFMSSTLKTWIIAGGVAIMSGRAAAQELVMQRNLSLAVAKMIAEATLEACKSKGFSTSSVVVDRAGQVLVMLRDEQATMQTAEMARR